MPDPDNKAEREQALDGALALLIHKDGFGAVLEALLRYQKHHRTEATRLGTLLDNKTDSH